MEWRLDLDERWMRLLLLTVAMLVGIDLLVTKHHVTVHAEEVPGFYAAVGFFGALLIVGFSKALARWVVREEDYYG